MTLKFNEWPWKTTRHLFYTTSSFVHHFKSIGEFKLELQSGNAQFGSKLAHVTLKFHEWPRKTIGHLFCTTLSFVQHFKAIGIFKPGVTVRKPSIRVKIGDFFVPHDLENWRMTLKNNRAPLQCCFKLCASFLWWIKTGVTVRKRPIWVKIDDFFSWVTLKFDGFPLRIIGYLF